MQCVIQAIKLIYFKFNVTTPAITVFDFQVLLLCGDGAPMVPMDQWIVAAQWTASRSGADYIGRVVARAPGRVKLRHAGTLVGGLRIWHRSLSSSMVK